MDGPCGGRADRRSRLAPGALALAFVRSRAFTASTIIGATGIAQLEALLDWFDQPLDAAVLADIAAVHGEYPNPTIA